MNTARAAVAVEAALSAFWREVGDRYPEAGAPALASGIHDRLTQAAIAAVWDYIEAHVGLDLFEPKQEGNPNEVR